MRLSLSTLAAAISIFATTAPIPSMSWAASTHLAITVPDMECESCAAALIANMRQDGAVNGVTADIEHRVLHVSLREGARLSPERIERIVHASGYTPGRIALER